MIYECAAMAGGEDLGTTIFSGGEGDFQGEMLYEWI